MPGAGEMSGQQAEGDKKKKIKENEVKAAPPLKRTGKSHALGPAHLS